MKAKIIFIAIALFLALGSASAYIPTIEPDIIFDGFGGGSVSGIVFGPTGETVIVMHDAQPVEIDIKTKLIVREFEKVPNATGSEYMFSVLNKGWLIAYARSKNLNGIKDFYGDVVWDITTGKIVHSIYGVKLLAESKTGKYYSYLTKGQKEYIGLFDINTFKFTDSVEFEQGWYHGVQQRFSAGFGIIPNSNKVIIGANVSGTRAMLYVLDFDTKKYTEIPIPFDDNQKSSTIRSIAVSETGKYFVVTMDVVNDLTAYLFYDKDFKFVFKETRKHLNTLFDDVGVYLNFWETNFIHDDYLICPFEIWSVPEQQYFYYADFYNISSKSITKRIKFEHSVSIDYNNNDIVILNALGKIALLDLHALPVENELPSKAVQGIRYKDSSLILNTTIADKVEIKISDFTGNILFSQKEVYLQSGINGIKLNIPLANGVYFCVIKTTSESNSYKFMVSQ